MSRRCEDRDHSRRSDRRARSQRKRIHRLPQANNEARTIVRLSTAAEAIKAGRLMREEMKSDREAVIEMMVDHNAASECLNRGAEEK